jgi:hypothetical protein
MNDVNLFLNVAREGDKPHAEQVREKSDEAIVLAKRLSKEWQLSAEVVAGRASPKGNSGPGSDTEPKSRADPNDSCAEGDERD